MRLTDLTRDDEAVSPVIGTFVLGLEDELQNSSPQASFTFEFEAGASSPDCTPTALTAGAGDNGVLTITHDGGDSINENRLNLTDGTNTEGDLGANCGNVAADSDVTAGTSTSV